MTEKTPFWNELQRRHVVRAGVAHIVVFWLLVQVAETALPYIGIVDEPVRWAVVAGVALFPVTLLIAWFFEHPWHRYTSSRVAIDLMVITVIGLTAFIWASRNLPQVLHTRTSIVILPFKFQENDVQGQSLSRALAYEINGLLMKSRSIDVVGYESASSSLLSGLDLLGIAELLDVQHLLSGTLYMDGGRLRVAVNLSTRGGSTLWSGELEDSLDNLYTMQERIATEVETRLGEGSDAVLVAEVAAARCPIPTIPEALERYYTARHYVESRAETEQSVSEQQQAVLLYQGLIEDYPDFAQARSGLSWALLHLTVYDPENSDREANETRADQLAREAYELCPTLGEALVLLPNEADDPNRWINQEGQWDLWTELQPDAVESWQKYTRHLREVGRTTDARHLAERNYALNPLSVRSIKALSSIYQYEERFDEAIALHDRAKELGSTSTDFARMMQHMTTCMKDLDCFMENLPEHYQPYRDQLRVVYTTPQSDADVQAAVDAAMEVFQQAPGMTVNFFTATSCYFDHLTPLFFELWSRVEETGVYWFWPNVWGPNCGNIWDAPQFPAFAENAGLVEYWREKDWPDVCQPDGDGFVCGQAVYEVKAIE